jgi:predicted Zn-dependent protease
MTRVRLLVATVVAASSLLAGVRLARAEDAKRLLEGKKYAEAAAAFHKTLEASPGDKAALLGLAQAVSEGALAAEFEGTASALRDAVKKEDDKALRLALGDVYLAWSREDNRWLADAEEQYRRVLEANPGDETAAVGLARRYYEGGNPSQAVKTLDEYLAKAPGNALALYWKGVVLYDQGTQQFAGAGSLTDEAKSSFEGALQALQAATKADPKRFDAWMKTGYAAQYLIGATPTRRDTAVEAYEAALELQGDDVLPMKGLSAVYANDAAAWGKLLEDLPKRHPKAPVVRYYLAYAQLTAKKYDDAEASAKAYVALTKTPAMGHYLLGQIAEAKGDEAGARKHYEASLKADSLHPRWDQAVAALEKPLVARAPEAMNGNAPAKALLKDYEALFALAPKDYRIRQNLAFFLREAFERGQAKDRAVLDASVKYYEEAAALVGEWRPEYEQSIPYPRRHEYAQVLNDTGLMFQYFGPVRDYAKAEGYYRRAMEWTQNGYWDTYGNLIKILKEQERWKDALEFAQDCSEGLKTDQGEPYATGRGTAEGEAKRLEEKVKAAPPK